MTTFPAFFSRRIKRNQLVRVLKAGKNDDIRTTFSSQEIVAHSTGRPVRIFDQVFLMAADEDDDAFEYDYKLKPLPRLAKRVSVYFNNNDMAIAVSDKTKGNPDRLGDDGPRVPRGIPGKVTLIDCTPVVKGGVEHSYFLDSPTVVTDMQKALAGTPADKIPNRKYVQETNRYRLVSSTHRRGKR